jgi:hypothetical protein
MESNIFFINLRKKSSVFLVIFQLFNGREDFGYPEFAIGSDSSKLRRLVICSE